MAESERPVPDPTILTTEQLLREVDRVKELMLSEIRGIERETGQRLHAIDERFDLVERQRVEQKADTKDAVDAAFSASKEAVREQTTASDRAIAKSETSMLEQLKQLERTLTTSTDALRRDIDEVKDRATRSEGQKAGGDEVKTTTSNTTQWAVGVGLAFVIFAVNVVLYLAAGN